MSIKCYDRLYLLTPNGEREIQLCIGDITRLPLEDKVDFILISCLANDYAATRTSVCGALKYNNGVDVSMLANFWKKEDLRRQFHCWISKPLPEHVPYRQLVCFERPTRGADTILAAVKEVFRALMPVFNNDNKSVITPLLGTGGQAAGRGEMLRTMVTTAVEWMRMGMPLKTLKIVVYPRVKGTVITKKEEPCLAVFEQLKKTIKDKNTFHKEPAVTHHVFLIHCAADVAVAKQITNLLQKSVKACKIMTVSDVKQTKPDSWQYDVYMAMRTCSRIVPLLSRAYLFDVSCMDQYNIALCCNRSTHRHILSPVCLERCPEIPVYMTLVQWINCRGCDPEIIQDAVELLVDQMSHTDNSKQSTYDVFISYSHRNLEQAKLVLTTLHTTKPDIKVFFDYEELKTGVMWQETLYKAIENSSCVLALLSPEYLASDVCQEELNLALVKHLSKDKTLELVPVIIKEIEKPAFLEFVTPVVMSSPLDEQSSQVLDLCQQVCHWLDSGNKLHMFSSVEEPADIDEMTSETREEIFCENYKFENGVISIKSKTTHTIIQETEQTSGEIYLSFTSRDQKYAKFVRKYLAKMSPRITVTDSMDAEGIGTVVDRAKAIAMFLSPHYMQSRHEVEELHLLLSKQRSTKSRQIMYIVQVKDLPMLPTYVHTVKCDTCIRDSLWTKVVQEAPKDNQGSCAFAESVKMVSKGKSMSNDFGQLPDTDVMALLKVCCDLQAMVTDRTLPNLLKMENNSGILLNIQKLMKNPAQNQQVSAEFPISEELVEENEEDIPVTNEQVSESDKIAENDVRNSLNDTETTAKEESGGVNCHNNFQEKDKNNTNSQGIKPDKSDSESAKLDVKSNFCLLV